MAFDSKALTEASKFLSYVLRHRPDALGIELDPQGWVELDELLGKCRATGKQLSRELVEAVVTESAKQRFALSDDGRRIRANQGHSVEVDLAYEPVEPPVTLFHGTIAASLATIRADGLSKMKRHHVHLSPDEATARAVAMRRGKPVVLRIATGRMQRDGYVFFRSTNGVWLTDRVPPEYIEFPA